MGRLAHDDAASDVGAAGVLGRPTVTDALQIR
eukprot:COSAG06_NODE_41631_length_389_cov_1.003448_1_plen_31_part_10